MIVVWLVSYVLPREDYTKETFFNNKKEVGRPTQLIDNLELKEKKLFTK